MLLNDRDNAEFKLAFDFITSTNQPVFLTGKAGTGKTTFLKYIQATVIKSLAIVAPTGVAAMNAGGATIHSFFQLPFTPFISARYNENDKTAINNRNNLLKQLKLTAERKEVLQQLDLLIIDEISMVRADLLDAINVVLRHVRHNYAQPFGGVQVLYIGDMYQLPPVVKREDWELLHSIYESPFFFSSHVIKEQPPVYIELNKVYRQKDQHFIHLLNQVRNNEMDEQGYSLLHSRFSSIEGIKNEENIIVLTTHNAKADAINNNAIAKIQENAHYFKASITGLFQDNGFPTDENLLLKNGAQVMFIKNDNERVRRYFNGKIGIVKKIENDKIWIECNHNNSTDLIELKKETWRNIKYTINANSGAIEEEELGSFTQFPLRLAWAITIHKSQGLTFEKVIIDAGNAFMPGQVYVALSRCRSLEGLHLVTRISMPSLQSDPRIVAFAQVQKSRSINMQILEERAKENECFILSSIFNFAEINKTIIHLKNYFASGKDQPLCSGWRNEVEEHWKKIYPHGANFFSQLNGNINNIQYDNAVFKQRVKDASAYFIIKLEDFNKILQRCPANSDNRQIAKETDELINGLINSICSKIHFMKGCLENPDITIYYLQKKSFKKSTVTFSSYSGHSAFRPDNLDHPELYVLLKNKRDQICIEHSLPVYLVCNSASIEQMTTYMPLTLPSLEKISGFGKIKVAQFGKFFISIIKQYCEDNNIMPPDLIIPVKKPARPGKVLKDDTKKLTFEKFTSGQTIAEIAADRKLAASTIEGHLAYFIREGQLSLESLVETATIEKIRTVRIKAREESLSGLKLLLPDISYTDIKFFMAAESYN